VEAVAAAAAAAAHSAMKPAPSTAMFTMASEHTKVLHINKDDELASRSDKARYNDAAQLFQQLNAGRGPAVPFRMSLINGQLVDERPRVGDPIITWVEAIINTDEASVERNFASKREEFRVAGKDVR
jgi:hypothetical protein